MAIGARWGEKGMGHVEGGSHGDAQVHQGHGDAVTASGIGNQLPQHGTESEDDGQMPQLAAYTRFNGGGNLVGRHLQDQGHPGLREAAIRIEVGDHDVTGSPVNCAMRLVGSRRRTDPEPRWYR